MPSDLQINLARADTQLHAETLCCASLDKLSLDTLDLLS